MPDAMDSPSLPDYENPPVVETVLGVQFDRLSRVKNAHLGVFWKSLDANEWPTISEAPPIPPQFEQFEETAAWARALQLKLARDPAGRLQIWNTDDDRAIQVQGDRLHFNRLRRERTKFPPHEKVQDEFVSVLDRFKRFVAEEGLGEVQPNQWEVTYVYQIPQGTVWTTPADWGFFRPLHAVPTVEGVIEGESFDGEWHFTIPQQRGRLHIQWQHGKAASEGNENAGEDFVRITFTARGSIADGGMSIRDGLDLGRATIVRSFESLMSDEANQYWRLKNASNNA